MYISGLLTRDRVTKPGNDQLFVSCGIYQWKFVDDVSPGYCDDGTVSIGRVGVEATQLEPRTGKVAVFYY